MKKKTHKPERKKFNNYSQNETLTLYKNFKTIESDYIDNILTNKSEKEKFNLHKKIVELNDFILSIKGKNLTNSLLNLQTNTTNQEDSLKIRKLAISPGGFVTMEYRRIIWKKLFCSKTNNFILGSEISQNKNNYDDIIDKDLNRSVIHHIQNYNSENFSEQDKAIIVNKLHKYLKNIFSKNDYYQGFHDFSIYILLLFIDDPMDALINITENIIKIYLLDYMNDKNKGIFTSVATILKEAVHMINQKIADQIEKDSSEGIYYTCISWIICLFSQNFKKIQNIYRVLDYILCSHPITIYIMAAIIILEEFEKHKKNKLKMLNVKDLNIKIENKSFIEYLREVEFDGLDLDLIIEKSENILHRYGIKKIVGKLRHLFVKK